MNESSRQERGAPLAPAEDPFIRAAVASVDAGRLEAHVRRLVSFGTRNTFSDADSETRGIGAARRWIRATLEDIAAKTGGRLKVAMEEYPVGRARRPVPAGTTVTNVVATLPGRDTRRLLIVSGHYDSRASDGRDPTSDAPGADDDASGVAVMLEAARALARLKPRATLVFVAYDGEEQGLWGSRAHARRLKEEGFEVAGMITNDIVGGVRGSNGRREPLRVRLFSEGVPSGPRTAKGRVRRSIVGSDNDASSRQLARYLRRRAALYVPGFEVTLIFRQDRYLRGGDHRSFNEEGFTGVRFTEPHENYDWQHQDVRIVEGKRYGDLPENLDYDFVKRVAQVNIAGLAELALAPAAPRQVRMMIDRLTPHTELRWERSKNEDVAAYGILWRRTHEPYWTHRMTVPGDRSSVLLEGLSKDDWLFAVEAVDAAGHRSLPVYPRPSSR